MCTVDQLSECKMSFPRVYSQQRWMLPGSLYFPRPAYFSRLRSAVYERDVFSVYLCR